MSTFIFFEYFAHNSAATIYFLYYFICIFLEQLCDINLNNKTIYSLSQLLENIDVSRYGSRFTLLNAFTGNTLVSASQNLADFYNMWNATVHQAQPNGFSLPDVLRSLRNITRQALDVERSNSSVGGQSMIGLIISHNAGISEADNTFGLQENQLLRDEGPDTTVLFLTGGTTGRFARFVRDESNDIFPLGTGASVMVSVNPVIQRIQTGMSRGTFLVYSSPKFTSYF